MSATGWVCDCIIVYYCFQRRVVLKFNVNLVVPRHFTILKILPIHIKKIG